ncbi:MAG: murein biosynthesis integral membrane protein MurJ, partial [Kiloniellales bacterium]|nr:murein biosynthesis integral membrane protein MurJ [Kiloniellales bacterium]
GMALRLPRPRLNADLRRLLRLMIPGVLSAGAQQLNLLVGTIIASLQAGAVSYLYYADRVYQLPLGLIGIAFGVVLLPDLTRKLRGGAEAAAMESLNRGLEHALLLTLPATAALIVIPWPIIVVLFERGAFDAEASRATAQALAAFALGLPAYVLVKVLQPAFFAREDTVRPLKMAAASVAANIALSLALFWPLGHVGLALATALAAWLNAGLLAWGLRRRAFLALDRRFRQRLPRIVIASVLMGAGLWAGALWLAPWFEAGQALRILGLALLVGAGLAAYALLALVSGAFDREDLRSLLSRRGRRAA